MKRVITADKIVEIETIVREHDRVVSFDDILDSVRIEYDDLHEAPWEACDGWEHEFRGTGYYDHPNASQRTGYVNRSVRDGGCGHIEIDDDTVKKWGYNGYSGASKQVRFEAIAAAKRKALEQLVKWYEDGWEWYVVYGEYDGYSASVGGVDSYEYAEELRRDIADEIADDMESDGYVIEDRSVPQPVQTAIENYRALKKYQQKCHNHGNRGGHSKRHRRYLRERYDQLLYSAARSVDGVISI